jgi:glycosyltransferase involved in cell wall biosynthesis
MTSPTSTSPATPAVSVVIPLYNTERYIRESIGSVLAQTFTNFELIIIDDGSSDTGPEIARSFKDARIRVITQDNRGLAGARNSGIRAARAPLVGLLDADDLWHCEKLAQHVAHLAANSEIGVSFSHSRLIDDAGAPIGLQQSPCVDRHIDIVDLFCRNPVGNGSAPVLRRATLDAIAFHDAKLGRTCWFDESFRQSEDIECWVRIAATTPWRFGCVAAPLTDYRITNGGLSANVEKQLGTWKRFRDKVRGYAPALEAEHGRRAEAYQLRYLARRAVKSSDGTVAYRLIKEALALHPAMTREEPARTLITLLAATGARLLPRALYAPMSRGAVGLLGRVPKLRV